MREPMRSQSNRIGVEAISAAKDAASNNCGEMGDDFDRQLVGGASRVWRRTSFAAISSRQACASMDATPNGSSDCRRSRRSADRAHGSALFTRGETQALVVTTLGTGQDEQIIDALEGEYREHFMLHYNFPPYSVGEASFLRSPGRREIGHGKLAWRAIHPLAAVQGRVPLYGARRLGSHRVERFVFDGHAFAGRRCR